MITMVMEKDFMKRIVMNQKILVGKPVIKGTRVAVYEIVKRVAEGWTFKDITDDLDITDDDIRAALMYAEKLLEGEEIFPFVEPHEVSG